MMRSCLAAVLLLLLAAPAFAQGRGQGVGDSKPEPSEKQKIEAIERRQRLEETERNYKATLKSQPDSKEKYDPWKGQR